MEIIWLKIMICCLELKMKLLNMTMALKQLRYRTTSSAEYAEDLNSEVDVYSLLTSTVVVATAVTQTYALRRMFNSKSTAC